MEKPVEGISESELLEEVFNLMVPKPLEEDEITVRMFMEKTGTTKGSAYKTLERYIEKGLLKSRKTIVDGHEVKAYSPANEGGWAVVLQALKK